MNRQPVLEGERLLLRPLQPSDWDALYAVGGKPEVWAQHPVSDRWEEPAFRAFFDDGLAGGGAFAVIDKARGRIIGSSRYGPVELDGAQVEIGWTFLSTDYWGGPFNREMKRLMVEHALANVDRVVFRVGDTNIRSRKAMEKIGGVLTDGTEEIDAPQGLIVHVIYEITRETFPTGPLAR